MQLLINNFGGVRGTLGFDFTDLEIPNGKGKTTILNAYYFLLTGKTLAGFVPRNAGTPDREPTQVFIYGFAGTDVIKRRLDPTGKQMIIVSGMVGGVADGAVITQTDFEAYISNQLGGVPFYLIRACAEPGILAGESLQPADLKGFLTCLDILQRDEMKELQKEKKGILERIREAEKYALTNVSIPVATCKPLTLSEKSFLETYEYAKRNANAEIKAICSCCGQSLPTEKINEATEKKREGLTFINNPANQSEYKRVTEKQQRFENEWRDIADCKRLVDASVRAREDVIRLQSMLADVEERIKEAINEGTNANLPEGVSIVTSIKQKNGKEKDTCELYYNGLPLKTVNTAKRIEICVEMLDNARSRFAVQDTVPIIIDNAERVGRRFEDVPFVVRLSVKR